VLIGTRAVIFIVALGSQDIELDFACFAEPISHTPLNRGIAIAIIVWLNGPAASSVAAGVEAAAFQVACAQVEPATLITTCNANQALVSAITAVTGAAIHPRF